MSWDADFADRYDEWSAHMTEDIATQEVGGRRESGTEPGNRSPP